MKKWYAFLVFSMQDASAEEWRRRFQIWKHCLEWRWSDMMLKELELTIPKVFIRSWLSHPETMSRAKVIWHDVKRVGIDNSEITVSCIWKQSQVWRWSDMMFIRSRRWFKQDSESWKGRILNPTSKQRTSLIYSITRPFRRWLWANEDWAGSILRITMGLSNLHVISLFFWIEIDFLLACHFFLPAQFTWQTTFGFWRRD